MRRSQLLDIVNYRVDPLYPFQQKRIMTSGHRHQGYSQLML